jgi:hypothetical protein
MIHDENTPATEDFAEHYWSDYIEAAFTYHAPKPGQPELYQAIRDKARELVLLIVRSAPICSETETAISKAEEAVWSE